MKACKSKFQDSIELAEKQILAVRRRRGTGNDKTINSAVFFYLAF